jgi:glycosyltransferase involved in cell wall biosynthesis
MGKEMKTAAFTIIANNYLPFARVLMQSLRMWAPELKRIVVLVDEPNGYFDPSGEDFEVILSKDLEIEGSKWFHFKYTILELSTAVKPFAAQRILERFDLNSLLYFDPDICIYGGLQGLLQCLAENSIVLTPHLTAPLEDSRRPSDIDILRSGSYNLGFIGIRRCEDSDDFLNWWQARLYEHCVVDLPKGLFVDQRWVDLVPGMFGGVAILRDPGLNAAYWNLSHREITKDSSGYRVSGSPLRFFHFSGFEPDNPRTISRHQDRFTLNDIGDGRDLFLDYQRALYEAGFEACRKWPYCYGSFGNGLAIPDLGRPFHREVPELLASIQDPFSDQGYQAFLDVWNHPLTGPDGNPSLVTRLAYRIYNARPDVQAAMPDIFGADLVRFLNWMVSSGIEEHRLAAVFVAPLWEALGRYGAKSAPEPDRLARGTHLFSEKVVPILKEDGIWDDQNAPEMERLNELIGPREARLRFSQLSRAIYQSRPDLRHAYPDPCDRDALSFLQWFLTYGAKEYMLSDALVAPLRSQWEGLLNSLNPFQRVQRQVQLAAMAGALRLRTGFGDGIARIRFVRAVQSAKRASAQQKLHQSTTTSGVIRVADPPLDHPSDGVNLIGYVDSEMGVGESVRCAFRAARAGGLRVAVKPVDAAGPYRRGDHSIHGVDHPLEFGVNIFHVNADQSEHVVNKTSIASGRYNIGYWAWELEEFPDRWLSAFRFFNEIWTPSTFCQTAISRKSRVPVIRMPHAIQVQPTSPADRSALGIRRDAFLFVAVFDLLSIFERKNPLGVIEAFRLAFSGSANCHLLLKINHGEQRPAEMAKIREAVRDLPVTIVDRTIDREDLTALMQAADCLVSLHRSEGFGLTIAEAMYLSVPVLVTAYSGNMDFTKPANSFLVDYRLVEVPRGCEPYDEGEFWAEPQLESAVAQMRLVAGNSELRHSRATNARQEVHTHLSPQSVGDLMTNRLTLLSRRVGGTHQFHRAAPTSKRTAAVAAAGSL